MKTKLIKPEPVENMTGQIIAHVRKEEEFIILFGNQLVSLKTAKRLRKFLDASIKYLERKEIPNVQVRE